VIKIKKPLQHSTLYKEYISKDPVIKTPRFKEKFELYTDASIYGAGAVLKQGQNIVSYFGKSWTDSESKQHILQLEAKAMLLAIKHFRYELTLYSKEPRTIIYCDNKNLVNILKAKEPPINRSLAIVYLEMLGLNVEIKHITSKENTIADAISRKNELIREISSIRVKRKRKHSKNKSKKSIKTA
jgi:hypothetical protein